MSSALGSASRMTRVRDDRRAAPRSRAGRAGPPGRRPGTRRSRGRTAHSALRILDLEAVLALEVDRVDRAGRRDSSTSSGAQVASASSLKRTPGERASRRRTGSIDGSLPRPSELTKRTGCGSSPSTSCSERPAWRSARSSAADSNAQLRKRSATSHPVAPATAQAWRGGRRSRPASTRPRVAARARSRAARCRPRGTPRHPRRAVRASAEEAYVRRDALELVGEDGVQAVVLARLDDERQPREPRRATRR